MKRCIYWVYKGFCLLLKDCKCNKIDKNLNETIDNCNPFRYTS